MDCTFAKQDGPVSSFKELLNEPDKSFKSALKKQVLKLSSSDLALFVDDFCTFIPDFVKQDFEKREACCEALLDKMKKKKDMEVYETLLEILKDKLEDYEEGSSEDKDQIRLQLLQCLDELSKIDHWLTSDVTKMCVQICNLWHPKLELPVPVKHDQQKEALEKLNSLARPPIKLLQLREFNEINAMIDSNKVRADISECIEKGSNFDTTNFAYLLFSLIKKKTSLESISDNELSALKIPHTALLQLLLSWSDKDLRQMLLIHCSKFMPVPIAVNTLDKDGCLRYDISEDAYLVFGGRKSLLALSASPNISDTNELLNKWFSTSFAASTSLNKGNLEIQIVKEREMIGHLSGVASQDKIRELGRLFDHVIIQVTSEELLDIRELKKNNPELKIHILVKDDINNRDLNLKLNDVLYRDPKSLTKGVEAWLASYLDIDTDSLDMDHLLSQKEKYLDYYLNQNNNNPKQKSEDELRMPLDLIIESMEILKKPRPLPCLKRMMGKILRLKIDLVDLAPGAKRDQLEAELEEEKSLLPKEQSKMIRILNKVILNDHLLSYQYMIHAFILEADIEADLGSKEEGNKEKQRYSFEHLLREVMYYYQNEPPEWVRLLITKQLEMGQPLEMIDGDNLEFSPFLQTALSMNNRKKQDLLVVTVLGPQSSGKSTVLNHLFGTQFLTSAQRCTKGAYVSQQNYVNEYGQSQTIMVIDTEGFESAEAEQKNRPSKESFGRRLIFSAIGFSNIVLLVTVDKIESSTKNTLQVIGKALSNTDLKIEKNREMIIFFNKQTEVNAHVEKNLRDDVFSVLRTHGTSEDLGLKQDNFMQLPFAFTNSDDLKGLKRQYHPQRTTQDFGERISKVLQKIFEMEFQKKRHLGQFTLMCKDIWEHTSVMDKLNRFKSLKDQRDLQDLIELVNSLRNEFIDNYQGYWKYTFDQEFKKISSQVRNTESLKQFCSEMDQVIAKEINEKKGLAIKSLKESSRNGINETLLNQQVCNLEHSFDQQISMKQSDYQKEAEPYFEEKHKQSGNAQFTKKTANYLNEETSFNKAQAKALFRRHFDEMKRNLEEEIFQVKSKEDIQKEIVERTQLAFQNSSLYDLRITNSDLYNKVYKKLMGGSLEGGMKIIREQLKKDLLAQAEVNREFLEIRRMKPSEKEFLKKLPLSKVFTYQEVLIDIARLLKTISFEKTKYQMKDSSSIKGRFQDSSLATDIPRIALEIEQLSNPSQIDLLLDEFSRELEQLIYLRFLPSGERFVEKDQKLIMEILNDPKNYELSIQAEAPETALSSAKYIKAIGKDQKEQLARLRYLIRGANAGKLQPKEKDELGSYTSQVAGQFEKPGYSMLNYELKLKISKVTASPGEVYILKLVDEKAQFDSQIDFQPVHEFFDDKVLLERIFNSFKALAFESHQVNIRDYFKVFSKEPLERDQKMMSMFRSQATNLLVNNLCEQMKQQISTADEELKVLRAAVSEKAKGYILLLLECMVSVITSQDLIHQKLIPIRAMEKTQAIDEDIFVQRLTGKHVEADYASGWSIGEKIFQDIYQEQLIQLKRDKSYKQAMQDKNLFEKRTQLKKMLEKASTDQGQRQKFLAWIKDSSTPLMKEWFEEQYPRIIDMKRQQVLVDLFIEILSEEATRRRHWLDELKKDLEQQTEKNATLLFQNNNVTKMLDYSYSAAATYFKLALSGEWNIKQREFKGSKGEKMSLGSVYWLPAIKGPKFNNLEWHFQGVKISRTDKFIEGLCKGFSNSSKKLSTLESTMMADLFSDEKRELEQLTVGCQARCLFCYMPCDENHSSSTRVHRCSIGHNFMSVGGTKNCSYRGNSKSSFMQTCEETSRYCTICFRGRNRSFGEHQTTHQNDWSIGGGSRQRVFIDIWNQYDFGYQLCQMYSPMSYESASWSHNYVHEWETKAYVLVADIGSSMSDSTVIEQYKNLRNALLLNEEDKGDKKTQMAVIFFNESYKVFQHFSLPSQLPSSISSSDMRNNHNLFVKIFYREEMYEAIREAFNIKPTHSYTKKVIQVVTSGNPYLEDEEISKLKDKLADDQKVQICFSNISRDYTKACNMISDFKSPRVTMEWHGASKLQGELYNVVNDNQ